MIFVELFISEKIDKLLSDSFRKRVYNHIDGLKLVTGNTKTIAYQCTTSWAFKRIIL